VEAEDVIERTVLQHQDDYVIDLTRCRFGGGRLRGDLL
jgi:hypothetical protein